MEKFRFENESQKKESKENKGRDFGNQKRKQRKEDTELIQQ